ncbi:ATP-grasp domain-containing protein [Paenibacillus chitinolyticus]|uniref:ATP-grasp domain-containing protein n=1 Tax=Paenibacillus chitinolyticus TaxID=79263 RepID=UPI0036DA1A49
MNDLQSLIKNTVNKKIFWYSNINHEQNWERPKEFPSVTDVEQLNLVEQQEQQMLIIADEKDVVLFNNPIEEDFLHYITSWGIKLPKIMVGNKIPWDVINQENGILFPYLCTEELVTTSYSQETNIFFQNFNLVKEINNKFSTRKLSIKHNFNTTEGYFCKTINELIVAFNNLMKTFDKAVIKIPYGSSGKGLKIIENAEQFEKLLKFVKRRSTKLNLLIEGWYDVSRNINSQLFINDSGYKIISINEQLIDKHGAYSGTKFCVTFEDDVIENYTSEIERLAAILYKNGYRGFAGIDSIIDRNSKMFPLIEINARLTQVTYLLPLVQELSKDYAHIESRFIKLETIEPYTFRQMHKNLLETLKPNKENDFKIYIFAKKQFHNKTIYRIFALFYGINPEKQAKMILDFINFPANFERS